MARRTISLILALVMALALTACHQNKRTETTQNTSKIHNFTNENARVEEIDVYNDSGETYSKELLMIPDANVSMLGAVKAKGIIYMYGLVNNDEQILYKMNMETHVFDRIKLPINCDIYRIFSCPDGGCGLLCFGESGEYIIYLLKHDEVWHEQKLPMLDEYENNIITQLFQTKNGFVAFTTDSILLLDSNGNLIKNLNRYDGIGACFFQEDGKIVIITQAMGGVDKSAPQLTTTILNADFECLETHNSTRQFTALYDGFDDGCSILCQNSGTIFKYNYVNDTLQPLVNTTLSGMYPSSIINIGGERLFSINNGKPYIWCPSVPDSITTLTLATYTPDVILLDYINTYNEKSTNYRINVVDYAAYDTGNDEQGLTRLRTDIISGKTPDIYDLSNLPAEIYALRGILEDLTQYFSKGSIIGYEDFVPSAIKALETNGGLYYIAPTYEVISVCGDASFVGHEGTWTPQDFFEATENMMPADVFGPETTKTVFLSYLLMFLGDEYIDKENLQCHFDDQSFVKFLEFASELPDNYEYSSTASNPSARAYVGKQPLLVEQIGVSAISFLAFTDTIFSGSAQYVGFPTSSTSGIAMKPHSLIAMSSTSQNKDGVIDFIYFLLSDPMQREMPYCPIIKDMLSEVAVQWENEYLEYPPVLYTLYDGAMVEIEGNTDLQTAKKRLFKIIDNICCNTLYDEEIFEILCRESKQYFEGHIPVELAVSNIQAKAELYLAEQYS